MIQCLGHQLWSQVCYLPVFNNIFRKADGSIDANPQNLTVIGATFDVEIHVPPMVADALRAAGQEVPAPITGLALIDTGATLMSADEACLQKLKLTPIGTIDSITAKGPMLQKTYVARLYFPRMSAEFNQLFNLIQLPGSDLAGQMVPLVPPQPMIVLLGRTALAHCQFTWNGPLGIWTLAY